MSCKLMDCTEPATVRIVSPFGSVDLCAGHAALLDSRDTRQVFAMLRETVSA